MESEKDGYVRVFNNLKTLEHDIIVSGNRGLVEDALKMAVALSDRITGPKVDEAIAITGIKEFSRAVLEVISGAKGAFAQALAEKISQEVDTFRVPDYISEAFNFLLHGDEMNGQHA
jgi:hypothetical protein